MSQIFEVVSWLAMVSLTAASIPQIILIFKRKSTEGVSWPAYALLFFGMVILFIRSLFTIKDQVIQANYGISTIIILIANIQFFYYRCLKKTSNN